MKNKSILTNQIHFKTTPEIECQIDAAYLKFKSENNSTITRADYLRHILLMTICRPDKIQVNDRVRVKNARQINRKISPVDSFTVKHLSDQKIDRRADGDVMIWNKVVIEDCNNNQYTLSETQLKLCWERDEKRYWEHPKMIEEFLKLIINCESECNYITLVRKGGSAYIEGYCCNGFIKPRSVEKLEEYLKENPSVLSWEFTFEDKEEDFCIEPHHAYYVVV